MEISREVNLPCINKINKAVIKTTSEIKYYQAADYYTIDEYGKVYNNKTNRYIKPHIDQHGYYQVKLYKTNDIHDGRASYLVHRLVATAFLQVDFNNIYDGRYSNKLTVDHIDGDKLNNYYKNLRWIPFLDNCNFAKNLGYNNPSANYEEVSEKLAKNIIQDIIDMYSDKEIMERRNVSRGTVSRIRQKKRWKRLSDGIDFPVTYCHDTRDNMLTIVYYAINTIIPVTKLVKLLNDHGFYISINQVYNIRNERSCKDYIKYVKQGKFKPSTTIL